MECSHWPTLTPTQILIPTPIMTKWVCNPFASVSVSVLASLNSSAYYNYRPQQSCGQGNIFTPVCHSVHRGVSASVHAGIPSPGSRHPPLGADTPPGTDTSPQSRHPPRSRHPPGSRLRHTVNDRPVRILLECILVEPIFYRRLCRCRCRPV